MKTKHTANAAAVSNYASDKQFPVFADAQNFCNMTPSIKAREALEQLFRQVQGLAPMEFPQHYFCGLPYVPIEGGDAEAIREYASLIREHVKNLASLIPTHRKFLLSVFQEHELDEFLATYGKKRPLARFARLVAELLKWVEVCKMPAKSKWSLAFAPAPLTRRQCLNALYNRRSAFRDLIIERLRRQLRKREREAARLKALNFDSIAEWEKFVRTLFDDCFKDRRCREFLIRRFACAPSRKQIEGVGLAKSNLKQNVCKRLKVLAGIKEAAKKG